MADRERNDLRREVEATRRLLEAREQRRTQLRRQGRPAGVRALGAAYASLAKRTGNRRVRVLVTAAAVFLGAATIVAPFSMFDDGPRLPRAAALADVVSDRSTAETDRPARDVTAMLSTAGSDGADEPDTPSGDPSTASGDAAADDAGWTSAAGPGVPTNKPSPEPTAQGATQETRKPAPEPSDTEETDDGPPAESEPGETPEPEPGKTPEPETPDEDAAAHEGTCLGVNALGLAVDLCLPSLLSS